MSSDQVSMTSTVVTLNGTARIHTECDADMDGDISMDVYTVTIMDYEGKIAYELKVHADQIDLQE